MGETFFWIVLGILLLSVLEWMRTKRKARRDKELADRDAMVRKLIQEEVSRAMRRRV